MISLQFICSLFNISVNGIILIGFFDEFSFMNF
jgi:hypothetical protein